MATAIGDLVVRLSGQSRDFDRTMTRARGMLGRMTGVARSALTVLAPLGGAALFAGVIRSGEQFNRAMRNSLAIMGDVSRTMRQDMRDAAFEVGAATQFGANQAAEAFFFLASAGLNARQSIAALPQVARFAQAGQFDLARATDLATDAQSALGLSVDDARQNLLNLTRVTDVLVKANTLANASVEQFSTALTNKAGPAMRALGMEIEEGVAVLAAFADQGLKAERAGTALDIVTRRLQIGARVNAEAWEQMNLSVFDSSGEFRNMSDIISELSTKLETMSDRQRDATLEQLGFTAKSSVFVKTLLGTGEAIAEYEKGLKAAGDTTKNVANKQLTPFQKGMAALTKATDKLGSMFVSEFAPAISIVLRAMGNLIDTVGPAIVNIVKFGAAVLGAVTAIAAVNAALRAYQAAQKAAAAATIFLQALAGPAAWAKIAAGIAGALLAIGAMNRALAETQDAAAQAKNEAEQAAEKAQGIGEAASGIEAVTKATEDMGRVMGNLPTTQLGQDFDDFQQQIEDTTLQLVQFTQRAEQLATRIPELDSSQIISNVNILSNDVTALRDNLEQMTRLADAPGQLGESARQAANAMDEARRRGEALVSSARETLISAALDPAVTQEEAIAQVTREIEQFGQTATSQAQALDDINSQVEDMVGVFGSAGDAVRQANQVLGEIQTPREAFNEQMKQVNALFELGLLDAAEATEAWRQASVELDRSLGGANQTLREMRQKVRELPLSESEAALRRFAEAARRGGRPGAEAAIEEFKQLQQAIDKFEKQQVLEKQGRRLAERLRTPMEEFKSQLRQFDQLLDSGAISGEVFARAVNTERRKLERASGDIDRREPQAPEFAGAIERGSAKAFSAVLSAVGQRRRQQQVEKEQIAAQQRTNELLQEIRDQREEEQVVDIG